MLDETKDASLGGASFLDILSQRRLRTSDLNFENILFANVNFEVFDAELRKRKQPDSEDE